MESSMSLGVLVAGAALVGVAASSIVLLRHHERSSRAAQARRFGWTLDEQLGPELRARLAGLTLFEVGHSRRVEWAYRREGPLYLLQYLCETGFEHRRKTHRWSVIVAPVRHALGTAVITAEDWLAATAELPARKKITGAWGRSTGTNGLLIVEDEDAWRALLGRQLTPWLERQPPSRSWEVLPEYVVGYDPGSPGESAMMELAREAQALCSLLKTADQDQPETVMKC